MNKMSEAEQQQWKSYLANDTYNYAITVTERDSDGPGSIYLGSLEMLDRIVKSDPDAKAVIMISANAYEHSHAHGVIKTTLPQRTLRSCSKGCRLHTREIYDAAGWINYMLVQGASQATITTEKLATTA